MRGAARARRTATPAAPPRASALLQRKCACGGTPGADGECAECKANRLGVQRKPDGRGGVPPVPPLVHDVLRQPGRPLDRATREAMEERLGHDFGRVRVHTDAPAAESARAVGALAYTVGRHVVFAAGRHAPQTAPGRGLLAHELAHVVQQEGAGDAIPRELSVDTSPASEAEAERAAAGGERSPAVLTSAPPVALRRQAEPTGEPPAEAAADEEDADLGSWLLRLLREVIRVLEQLLTLPPPFPTEALPAQPDPGCRRFGTRADLEARKAFWDSFVAGRPESEVIRWIIGQTAPPAAAATEARQQVDCMMARLGAAAAAPGSTLHLPPSGASVQSPHRSAAHQSGIWNRKFQFRGAPFDRISDHARTVCGALLLAGESRWDPAQPRHRACWGVAPLAAATAPAMPAGARSLSDDERQQEILQASSAPGISRHHWGTDFDVSDPALDPHNWEAGQPLAGAYGWLLGNAATYGFIQSFTPFSTFMTTGYMEERWHWSYWPIAQALLEFARRHERDVGTQLVALWGGQRQFSFIRRHWRDFMFNVNQGPGLP